MLYYIVYTLYSYYKYIFKYAQAKTIYIKNNTYLI